MTDHDPTTVDPAQVLTEGWMAHLGYTEDQIALTRSPRPHNRGNPDLDYRCELTAEGWQCWDGDGEPAHPIHNVADEIAEQVMWTLDALAAAGRLLPEGGQTRDEWGARPKGWDERDTAWIVPIDDEERARKSLQWEGHRRAKATLVHRTVTDWPNGARLIGPWEPVPDTDGGEKT